jgi:hypothetical protein
MITRQTAASSNPGEGSFHHPARLLHSEAVLAGRAADENDSDR